MLIPLIIGCNRQHGDMALGLQKNLHPDIRLCHLTTRGVCNPKI
jgi:hypothetical protein